MAVEATLGGLCDDRQQHRVFGDEPGQRLIVIALVLRGDAGSGPVSGMGLRVGSKSKTAVCRQ
jgi:hypothetical protein